MNRLGTEVKWGFVFAGATLIWMILERLVGLHTTHIDKHAVYTNLFAFVAIGLFILALKDKRNNVLNGQMTYKEGFQSGVVISLMVGVLSPVGQLITAYVISPDYFENAINYAVANDLTSLEAAQAYFNLKNYIFISSISAPIMGIFTTAIVAFFLKTDAKSVPER